jgi:hypothetical protein
MGLQHYVEHLHHSLNRKITLEYYEGGACVSRHGRISHIESNCN